ncbi:hypothetical protein [Sphingosinicella sp. BN140058]|uniref:GH12 family glycosyl hydrolase domain-containing protein n=1 Tax=Sphingosinicella sp. BN140058 TaxID=1892855 RepID=UPI001010D2B6|nr:hypothetical protein [Sphingosinicella sp. BN140058]QAY77246.1 hypothetical protein ETR14_12600 [Sphingosinicella sp. BN140058]
MYITATGVELRLSTKPVNWVPAEGATNVRNGTGRADAFQGIAGTILVGGLGDDTYHMWASTANAVESGGQGIDTVYAYYWGSAGLGGNVENLVVSSPGITAASGNALDNIIVAGAAGATINGLSGNDVLVGGSGSDIFVVTTGNGSDAIYNFRPGYDVVRLGGYGITGFDQIVARAQQVGSDLKIGLTDGQSLVLRDIRLEWLDPADFGFKLPKSAVPGGFDQMHGPDRGYNAHGWYVMTNAWNPGSLKYGTDFSIDTIYSRNDMTKGATFNWSFPYTTEMTAPIRAYPNVMFGIGPHGEQLNPTDTSHVFPARVGDLASLKATFDITAKGNVGGFNVAYDIWFTTKPDGNEPTVTNELMIWLHKGDVKPFGEVIGTYSDGAFTGTIYRDGHYTAIIADKDVLTGTIDITKMVDHLQALGYYSDDEYLAAISLGSEVISGNGSIRINDFDLNVVTSTPTGLVQTLVTGAGSTISAVAAAAVETVVDAGSDILHTAAGVEDSLFFGEADQAATTTAGHWFADSADAGNSLAAAAGPIEMLSVSDFLF